MMNRILLSVLLVCISISAYCQTTRGTTIVNSEEKPVGKTYALIVGISNYLNIAPLKFADKDAALFRQYVQSNAGGNVADDDLMYLVNDSAKGGTLNVAARKFIEDQDYKKGDKLFIFLAGHGDAIDADEYFFLGQDISTGNGGAKNNYTAGLTLQMYNLKISIKRAIVKGADVVLIMDACRTSELAGGASGQQMFATGITQNPRGEEMMYSASPGQSAIESISIGGGHGLFTWHLIDGLSGTADRNKDSIITQFELEQYVKTKVADEAQSKFSGHEQIPYFCCSEMNNRIVGKVDREFQAKWIEAKTMNKSLYGEKSIAVNNKNKRSGDTTVIDPALINNFNLFTDAIKKDKLIGEGSAEVYYNAMKAIKPLASLTQDARYTLASEYLNYANGKINLYLAGKDQTSEAQYQSSIDGSLVATNKYKIVATIPYKITASYINKAIALLEGDTAMIRKLTPQLYFFTAKSFYESNPEITLSEAIRKLKAAVLMVPDAAYLHEFLGELYISSKDFKSAEKEVNKSINLAPTWSYNYCTMGRVFHEQKKYDLAESWYKKAIMHDSTYNEVYSNLGNLYQDMDRPAEAEYYYKKSLQYDSTNITVNSTRLYNLGVYYEKQKKVALAETYYRQAIKADSTNSLASNNLSVVKYVQQNFTEAEYFLNLALRHDSMLFYSYNNLGLVYGALNKSTEEERCYKKAIKLNPANGAAYINLSELYIRQVDTIRAIKCLEKAVQSGVTSSEICCYNLACLYADSRNIQKSIYYFELALQKGYADYDNIKADTQAGGELFLLNDNKKYKELMKKYFPKN